MTVPLFPFNDQSSPPGDPAKATHLLPSQKYKPGATLFGTVPAVAVFQTVVPATSAPPCGLTTGAATFVAVKDTLGGIKPLVVELTSNAPAGVVVPTPTCATILRLISRVNVKKNTS